MTHQDTYCKSLEILKKCVKREPIAVSFPSSDKLDYCLSYWRYVAGEYRVDAIPSPVIILHLGGKPRVRLKKHSKKQLDF